MGSEKLKETEKDSDIRVTGVGSGSFLAPGGWRVEVAILKKTERMPCRLCGAFALVKTKFKERTYQSFTFY